MDIGHNGGPPLDENDEPPGKLLFVNWAWRKARKAAFTAPTHEIALFRLARAEAAGMTYEAYVAQLLDTGRYDQVGVKERRRNRSDTIPKPNPPNISWQPRRPLLQSGAQSPHAGQDGKPKGRLR
jgi:hypothetical protein